MSSKLSFTAFELRSLLTWKLKFKVFSLNFYFFVWIVVLKFWEVIFSVKIDSQQYLTLPQGVNPRQ